MCGTDFFHYYSSHVHGKKCGQHKIPGRLIPVPREITAGCGLAWKMLEEDYESYKAQVKGLDITVEQKVKLKL